MPTARRKLPPAAAPPHRAPPDDPLVDGLQDHALVDVLGTHPSGGVAGRTPVAQRTPAVAAPARGAVQRVPASQRPSVAPRPAPVVQRAPNGTVVQRVGKTAFGYEKVAEQVPENEEEGAKVARERREKLALAVEDLIQELKVEEKEKKRTLEETKNKKMESLGSEEDRRDYLFGVYVPALSKIGVDGVLLGNSSGWKKLAEEEKLTAETSGDVTTLKDEKGLVFYKLFHGAKAFRSTTPKDEKNGLKRDVYTKIGSNKEYVQDDLGQYTRRHAYVEKNKFQYWKLMEDGELIGRYAEKHGKNKLQEKNSDLEKRIRFRSHGKDLTPWELAYTHQELGSGSEQRGVSLSSTSKLLHSNQGSAFKSEDGATITIDLALLDPGSKEAPNLINHYSKEAQENQKVGLKDVAMYTKYGGNQVYSNGIEHYQKSVLKNRELFARTVPLSAITKIVKRFQKNNEAKDETLSGKITFKDSKSESEKLGFETGKKNALKGFDLFQKHPTGKEDVGALGELSGYNEGVNYNLAYNLEMSDTKRTGRTDRWEHRSEVAADRGKVDGHNAGVTYNLAFKQGYDVAWQAGALQRTTSQSASPAHQGYADGYNRAVGKNKDDYDLGYDRGKNAAETDIERGRWARQTVKKPNDPYDVGWTAGYNSIVPTSKKQKY